MGGKCDECPMGRGLQDCLMCWWFDKAQKRNLQRNSWMFKSEGCFDSTLFTFDTGHPTSIPKDCSISQPISRQHCMVQTIRGHSWHPLSGNANACNSSLDCWIILIFTMIIDIYSTNISSNYEVHSC